MEKTRPLRIFDEKKDPFILIRGDKIDKKLEELIKKHPKNFLINQKYLKVKLKSLPEEVLFKIMTLPLHKKKKRGKKVEKNELKELFENVIKNPPKQSRKRGRLPRPTSHINNLLDKLKVDEKNRRPADILQKLDQRLSNLEKELKSSNEKELKSFLSKSLSELEKIKKNIGTKAIEYKGQDFDEDDEVLVEIMNKKYVIPKVARDHYKNTINKLEETSKIQHNLEKKNEEMELKLKKYKSDYNKKADELRDNFLNKDIRITPLKNFVNKLREKKGKIPISVGELIKDKQHNEENRIRIINEIKKDYTKKEINDAMGISYLTDESDKEEEKQGQKLIELPEEEIGNGDNDNQEGLSDTQLNSIMESLPNYYGCVSNDDLMDILEQIKHDEPEEFYFIYLKNKHWIAIFCNFNEKEIDYFDCLGRPSEASFRGKFKSLFSGMKVLHMMKWKDNHIVNQGGSDLCGIYAMWFIMQRVFGFKFKESTDWENINENEKRFSKAKINFGFV